MSKRDIGIAILNGLAIAVAAVGVAEALSPDWWFFVIGMNALAAMARSRGDA